MESDIGYLKEHRAKTKSYACLYRFLDFQFFSVYF